MRNKCKDYECKKIRKEKEKIHLTGSDKQNSAVKYTS